MLKTAERPLTYQEIWEAAKSSGLAAKMKTTGKTPWQSLGAQLYVDVRDNAASKFVKVGKRPARFFLKSREGEIPSDAVAKIEKEEAKKPIKPPSFRERDLHPCSAILRMRIRPLPAADRSIQRPSFTKPRARADATSGFTPTWWAFICRSKTGAPKS